MVCLYLHLPQETIAKRDWQARSHGVAWVWTIGCHLSATPGNLFCTLLIIELSLQQRRNLLKLWISLTLVYVTYLLESSIFSCTHIIYLIIWNMMKYEISSQILYPVIPPGQFCHTCNTDLATGLGTGS